MTTATLAKLTTYQRTQRRRFWGATKPEAFRRAEDWLSQQPQGYGVSYPSGKWTPRGYCLTLEMHWFVPPQPRPAGSRYPGQYMTGHLRSTDDLREGLPLKRGE